MRSQAISLAVMAVFLAACGQPEDPTASASTGPAEPGASERSASEPPVANYVPMARGRQVNLTLPQRLDCLHEEGGVLLIGHRGGPTRDYPENAIETLERTFKAGTRGMEIDIAQTKDGVLMLMHDDELDRTSTGTGLVSDHTWAEISKLKLETYSKETTFAPSKLEDALAWAVKSGAILELDKKKSAPWAPIIAAVRAAKAENNVFLITYSDDQAIEVHKAAPDLVITASVDSAGQLDHLLKSGVNAEHLVAWTGTSDPDPALWKTLSGRGIESAFGTLGPRNSSLDGKYWDDGDGSEYDTLVSGGLPILVTDITDKVSRQLAEPVGKAAGCGL
jgi:glycerophosphoryl diester phosphodiesterase